MEEIRLFEAIYSQRQITRYKPDPVPREAIDKMRMLHMCWALSDSSSKLIPIDE